MQSDNSLKIKNHIPASLNKQICRYRSSLFKSESIIGFAFSIASLFFSFILLFISDRIWNTPITFRFFLILVGVIAAIFFICKLFLKWFYKQRSLKQIATKIQDNHRELGDRLLGVIELANSEQDDEFVSEELAKAALQKIAKQASGMNFQKDIDKKRPMEAFIGVFLFAIIAIILYFSFPIAFENAFNRWFNPLSSIDRYTFVKFKEHKSQKYVPMGEPFKVMFEISPDSKWVPSSLSYKIKDIVKGSVPINSNQATISLNGIDHPVSVVVNAGDRSDQIKIIPIHRPSLLALNANIKFPKYLGRKDEIKRISNGSLKIVKGTQIKFTADMSRELKDAKYTLYNKLKNGDLVSTKEGKGYSTLIKGVNFATDSFIPKNNCKFSFSWIDILNLRELERYDLNLKIEEDQPPIINCPKLALFSAILIDESMNIDILSDDDYGIKEIGVEYSYIESKENKIVEKVFLENTTVSNDDKKNFTSKGKKGHCIKKLETNFLFSPNLVNIPEKIIVTLRAFAKDYYPNRKLIYSIPYQIYILSHEQHVKILQDRLERIMTDVEDMIRREEASLEKNQKISKLSPKKMQSKKTTEEVKSQKQQEADEKKKAESLTQKGVRLLKEALRNKKFPKKSLSEWSKLLEQLKSISQKEMKAVVKNLQKAGAGKSRKAEMKKAIKNQKEMLKKLKKILKEMDDSLKSLSLDTFVNRLKKEAKKEKTITTTLKDMIKDIIGLRAEEIEGKLQELFYKQIDTQDDINKQISYIQDDLNAFFARTRIEKYKTVIEDMENFDLQNFTIKLYKNIATNYTSKSIIDSKIIADKLLEWAKILSENDNKKSSDDNKKCDNPSQIDPEFLIGLMRLIQGEQNLREKTRYLNLNKPDKKSYNYQSFLLSGMQGDLHLRMGYLMPMAKKCSKAMQLLIRTGKVMDEVVTMLRKPQTDAPVIAAETEIIELLASAFKSANQQSNGSASNSMMAMLMQMMMQQGKGSGSTPGRGANGGPSNITNKHFDKPGFEKDETSNSKVDKSRGASEISLPEEYKKAIENYFEKREFLKE